jgi:hypothetical protein
MDERSIRVKRREIQKKRAERQNKNVIYALQSKQVTGRFSSSPNFHWTSVFPRLLYDVLGWEWFWADLKMTYHGLEDEKFLKIRSSWDSRRARNSGGGIAELQICLYPGHHMSNLRENLDSLSMKDEDWTEEKCKQRKHSITLEPAYEFSSLLKPVDSVDANDKRWLFSDFPSWRHAVCKDNSSPRLLYVYHADFNFSYPVVQIVARALKLHHGPAPSARV